MCHRNCTRALQQFSVSWWNLLLFCLSEDVPLEVRRTKSVQLKHYFFVKAYAVSNQRSPCKISDIYQVVLMLQRHLLHNQLLLVCVAKVVTMCIEERSRFIQPLPWPDNLILFYVNRQTLIQQHLEDTEGYIAHNPCFSMLGLNLKISK